MARFIVLDSWRGIAALLVALFHLAPRNGVIGSSSLVQNSWLFVDFFFVLSGFVISHAYSRRIATGKDAALFLRRRFARIWPLHASILAAGLLLVVCRHLIISQYPSLSHATAGASLADERFREWLVSLLLLDAYGLNDALYWNQPSWSISAEFGAYVAFAGACLLARNRTVLVALITIGTAVLILASQPQPTIDATFQFGIVRCLYGFSCGHLAYHLRQHWTSIKWPTAAELGALAAAVMMVAVAANGPLTLLAPAIFMITVVVFSFEAGVISR